MSVLATPLPHQPFSDPDLYASAPGPRSTHELSPPLPVPGATSTTIPFPSFQHRHSSPYPMPHPHSQSFSALGPAQSHSEGAPHSLGAVPPPPAPKVGTSTLPAVTPDLHPQSPLPPTPEASPPGSKVLGPTMMIKLAPPADDVAYEIGVVDIDRDGSDSQSSSRSSTIPRRLPVLSVDPVAAPMIRSASDSQRTPSPRPRISSAGGSGSTGLSSPPMVKSASSTDPKPARPKSMGPAPRPRRSQTSHHYPHPHPSAVRMAESRSADSRAKLRGASALRGGPPSAGPSGSPILGRAPSDSAARGLRVAGDMAPPDLGGPDGLEAKVVLLGSQGVGKTSLILRYTTREFALRSAPATLGTSLHTRKLVHDGTRVKLQIWDTAGQERFRSMAPIYYRGAHVCILVYDISDRQSFEDVRSWLEELGRSVPKETVIFVVGAKIDLAAKRAVELNDARETIRSWIKPPEPEPAPPTPLLSPPSRNLFRTSTFSSRAESSTPTPSPTPVPTASRNHSYISHVPESRSAPLVPPPRHVEVRSQAQVQGSVPFPGVSPDAKGKEKEKEDKDKSKAAKRTRRHSQKPFPVVITTSPTNHAPTSPSHLTFPSLQSPTLPTSATTTQPIDAKMTPASSMSGHRSRFSISGVLGLNRTTSMSGAMSSLTQLHESPPAVHTGTFPSPAYTRTPNTASTGGSGPVSPPRARVESTPLLAFDYERSSRRRSEDWSSRPGAVEEALSEFGVGVRKKESEELLGMGVSGGSGMAGGSGGSSGFSGKTQLGGAGSSGFVLGKAGQGQNQGQGQQGRSRGGSLGRDSRLMGDVHEGEVDGWGVDVEGVRLGECSALTGQGVEALFKAISSVLVQRKDKIERERVLRHKNSVILVDAPGAGAGAEKDGKKAGYGCCV
ncbi:hypothetical protein IAT38_005375 [Cryptococcus sp. DSM 104549]